LVSLKDLLKIFASYDINMQVVKGIWIYYCNWFIELKVAFGKEHSDRLDEYLKE